MILYPAIDLKNGQCVRLVKGDMNQATVFNADPVDQAARFEAAGARWLHCIDLDGAIAGRPVNAAAIEAVLKATGLSVQLGGGIRDRGRIESWLEKGVSRVVLGTVAVRDPDLVKGAARSFPGRIAVAIDARGGKVAVEGWARESELTAAEMAARFADAGVAVIVYTDIDRDGLLQGVNVEATADLASRIAVPVIASGGLAGPKDIERLKAESPRAAAGGGGGIDGVIAGRALYDGRLDLAQAIASLSRAA